MWQGIVKTIPVVLHFRDLGAHASTGMRLIGVTLNDRLRAALRLTNKLALTRWTYIVKQNVVQTLVLPTAFYGCEITPYAISEMGLLYTAVAKCIAPYNHLSSNPMAFSVASPRNLDPVAEVLSRRIIGLMRCIAKHPRLRPIVDNIFRCYQYAGAHGTRIEQDYLQALTPAPPPNIARLTGPGLALARKSRACSADVSFLLGSLTRPLRNGQSHKAADAHSERVVFHPQCAWLCAHKSANTASPGQF